MAATFGQSLVATYDPTDASSYSPTVTTPTSGRVVFLFVASPRANSAINTPTVSGLGATWTQEITVLRDPGSGTRLRGTAFWGYASSYSGTSVTIDFAAQTQLGCVVMASEWTGVDTSDGTVTSRSDSGSAALYTFAFAGGNSNSIISFSAHLASEATTPGTNYTEISDVNNIGPNMGAQSQYESPYGDQTTASWATSSNYIAIALEVRDAAAATDNLGVRRLRYPVGAYRMRTGR